MEKPAEDGLSWALALRPSLACEVHRLMEERLRANWDGSVPAAERGEATAAPVEAHYLAFITCLPLHRTRAIDPD